MVKRQKTAFEKWFSLSRHQRRQGAAGAAQQLLADDVASLKARLVEGEAATPLHGSYPDLAEHLAHLRREFSGQPELLYQHAALIVLIRREADTAAQYARFRQLWEHELDFLRTRLDLRWLVAACDTLLDHDPDPLLKAVVMNAVLLVNTVKLAETERGLTGATALPDRPDALARYQSGRVALFDGLTAFTPGTDDTLRNMRWRLDAVCAQHRFGALVIEVFERLQQTPRDNVYSRFRARHTRTRNGWWHA